MSDATPEIGTLRRQGDGFEGRLSRVYAGHAPADLWAMLTEPAKFALWLAPGSIELREGGAVRISFEDSGIAIDSRLTAFEPGARLAYSWSSGDEPARPLDWRISPAAEGVRLDLTVMLPAGDDAAKSCAGFEGHLEMLGAALEGVPVSFPLQLYLAARKAYGEQLADA